MVIFFVFQSVFKVCQKVVREVIIEMVETFDGGYSDGAFSFNNFIVCYGSSVERGIQGCL